MEEPENPVPQGKRGILWAWPGQISHLSPPAVGIMALINHKRLEYSLSDYTGIVPGVSSKAIQLPDNTVHYGLE